MLAQLLSSLSLVSCGLQVSIDTSLEDTRTVFLLLLRISVFQYARCSACGEESVPEEAGPMPGKAVAWDHKMEGWSTGKETGQKVRTECWVMIKAKVQKLRRTTVPHRPLQSVGGPDITLRYWSHTSDTH